MSNEWELPTNVKPQSIEHVGGGRVWESGVYDAVVKMVYLDQAKSEAVSFNVLLTDPDGKELKEALYIKSGKAKGNKTFYTGQDGVDRPLPGYSVANSLCIAVTGESLAKNMATVEKKTVNIYNYDLKKDVPTERPVLMNLIGKPVKVAVSQITEDKNKKNNAGQYVPTGETRSKNECKFFGNAAGQTAEEILSGDDPVMFDKWAEKNTGAIIDKSTQGAKPDSAAAIMGGETTAETSTSSIFS